MDMEALQRDLGAIISCMKSLQVRNKGETDRERTRRESVHVVYVYMLVGAKTRKLYIHTDIYTHIYIHIHTYTVRRSQQREQGRNVRTTQ
jgi:hypothetical protein